MNRLFVSALGALSVLACQSPASAQIVKVTASGVVSFGYESAGNLFDAPGAALSGDAFSYTATFNIAHAGFYLDANRSDIYGGAGYSYLPYDPPSLGGGVLTINGQSQTVAGQWNSDISAGYGPTFTDDTQFAQDIVSTDTFYENNVVQMVEDPAFGLLSYPDLVLPTGNLCAIADCTSSSFAFYETTDGALSAGAYGNLAPSEIVITISPAPAPEPAAWALMLTGFAGLGTALRKARRPIVDLR